MPSRTPRVYLDNAATSWPKPDDVYRAMDEYQRSLGAPAGRGSYREASEVDRLIREARLQIAQLIAAPSADQVLFTFNGTDSLNLAIHGVLRTGDHVVTTVMEHNSVLRPLRYLSERKTIDVSHVDCDASGRIEPDAIRRAITPQTRLIALIHASNVTGTLQPIEEVGRIAAEHDVLLLVDAAQSLGQVPIDVAASGIHMLAAPGHKGLLGPLGTGVLYVSTEAAKALRPVRQGGTGTHSEDDAQPQSLPEGFEAGNHNVPGLVGLLSGVHYVRQRGVEQIRRHETALAAQLVEGLGEIPGAKIYGPQDATQRVGVVSIRLEGVDPQEVAAMLDSAHSVQVRSGLHCAALAHRSLGTLQHGGTIRFSPGPLNDSGQIDRAVRATAEIASALTF